MTCPDLNIPDYDYLKSVLSLMFYFDLSIGQLGLILKNEVAASMKGDTFYDSNVAVTNDSLCAASCTCKAGSHGLNRGVYVHNLPLILQFVLLLIDGLGNHILVELCQRWNTHLESKISNIGKLDLIKMQY